MLLHSKLINVDLPKGFHPPGDISFLGHLSVNICCKPEALKLGRAVLPELICLNCHLNLYILMWTVVRHQAMFFFYIIFHRFYLQFGTRDKLEHRTKQTVINPQVHYQSQRNQNSRASSTVVHVRLYRPFGKPLRLLVGCVKRHAKCVSRLRSPAGAQLTGFSIHIVFSRP